MKANQRTTSLGFTLIELLVSLVITTIIVTILVTVTVTSLDIWNRSRSEVRASLQGKAMIDSMAADFESMAVRSGNNFQWLFAQFDGENIDYVGDEDKGPNRDLYLSPAALDLIFFSAATDRYDGNVGDANKDKVGDISGIGYKLVYKDPISDDSVPNLPDNYKTFVLYRKLVNPKHTFNKLLGQTALKNAFDILPNDPDEKASNQDIDANKNFVCENVYQFTVKFYVNAVDKNSKTRNVPITLSSTNKTFIVSGNGLVGPTGANTGLTADFTDAALAAGKITSVEVSLTVLTDFGLKQLQGRSFSDSAKLSDFISQNSYQYSKLIPVPSY